MTHRLWWRTNQAVRWLHSHRLLPGRIKHWVCDRFDQSLGLTPEEMGSTGKTNDSDSDNWTENDALTERQIRDHMDRENWRQADPMSSSPAQEEDT